MTAHFERRDPHLPLEPASMVESFPARCWQFGRVGGLPPLQVRPIRGQAPLMAGRIGSGARSGTVWGLRRASPGPRAGRCSLAR